MAHCQDCLKIQKTGNTPVSTYIEESFSGKKNVPHRNMDDMTSRGDQHLGSILNEPYHPHEAILHLYIQ